MEPGQKIADRFDYERTLGEGGQGATFLAFDPETDSKVALKRLHFSHMEDWKALELFEREGEALRGLSHPSIPRYVAAVRTAGALYLAQEYVAGETLSALISRPGALGLGDAFSLARAMLDTLTYLHGRTPPVIHRDIKPSNIIRREGGGWSLIDFGAVQAAITTATSVGTTVVGTAGYMPPEQAVGDPIGPYTDLFALALVLAEFLTGQLRLKGDTHAELMSNLVGPEPIDISDTPRLWQTWLSRMLAKDPKARPQSAQEALYELEESVELELTGALQPGEFEFDSERNAFIPSTNPGILALDQVHASFLDSDEPLELDLEAARQTRHPSRPSHSMFTPMNASSLDVDPLDAALQSLDTPLQGTPDSTAVIPASLDRPSSRTTRRRGEAQPDDAGSFATVLAVGLLSCIGVLLVLFMIMLLRSALF